MKWLAAMIVQTAGTIVGGHLATTRGRASAIRVVADALKNPGATLSWLKFLAGNKLAQRQLRLSKSFTTKAMGRYLNKNYQFSDRVRAIVTHYDFIAGSFHQDFLSEIYFGAGVQLADFAGRSGKRYKIVLGTYSVWHPEGEMKIAINTHDDCRICFAIFSVGAFSDGELRIELGCIQGARPMPDINLTKIATSDFHSMRPKHLLIAALYEFARSLNITSIVCVSTNSQISTEPFLARYDPFWLELDGKLYSDGFYHLPSRMSHRDRGPGGRGHASRHRRRVALKSAIAGMIRQSIERARRDREITR
jgi:uncharacterized protein VirK/YbjX